MSIARVNTDYLTGAADAIRRKTGSQNPIPLTQFENEIDNIPSGGGTLIPKTITQNGVYNANSDNADGYDVVTVDVPEKDEYTMLAAVMNKTATEIISDKINEIDSWSCSGNQALKRVILNSANFYGSPFPSGNSYVFYNCKKLKYLLFPNSVAKYRMGFGNYYAQGCENLLLVIVNAIDTLGGSSFVGCRSLKTFIIRKNDQIQELGISNIFNNSGISSGTGFVYVPDSLKSNYQIATNWSYYSSQIRGYQDAPNYSSSNQYTVGDVCKHNNKFYVWINLTDGNSEPTNAVDTYTDWYCVADIEVI